MSGTLDLEIDTFWIRRAAGGLDEAAQCFMAGAADQPQLPLAAQFPDQSGIFAAAVAMANARSSQAHAAAAQLGAVAAAVGQQLLAAADRFDRAEAALRMTPR